MTSCTQHPTPNKPPSIPRGGCASSESLPSGRFGGGLLLADSGGTKTQWTLCDAQGNIICETTTRGINPLLLSDEEVVEWLSEVVPWLQQQAYNEQLSISNYQLQPPTLHVHFYGSGVIDSQRPRMTALMARVFNGHGSADVPVCNFNAESDMLAAAQATCGRQAGIVCILGTGANSCLYDGEQIACQTPALGYILGDEGGAAYMGKRLINAMYKTHRGSVLQQMMEKEMQVDMNTIINRVYRQSMPNTFLASFAPFIARHISSYPLLEQLVNDSFDDFIQRNLLPYDRATHYPVHAIGGVATAFAPYWQEALQRNGFGCASIVKSPTEGLIRFLTDNQSQS